ncbi:MAG: hypothetical protein KJ069_20810 [Anaerolineae bacterium]|nr:hypothetical protein [Anaerolineae bacterium]
MMKTKVIWMTVIGMTVLLAAASIASAIPLYSAAQEAETAQITSSSTLIVPDGTTAAKISYQGRLTNPGGGALNGTFVMRFVIYDDAAAGTAVYDSGNMNVAVTGGLFNVQLTVDQNDFNGQALWLSIIVGGEALSPRQELLPAPYALSLRPGADIVGAPLNASDSVLDVELTGLFPDGRAGGFAAPATGTAIVANANGGTGLHGSSASSYGIWGNSQNSWGGYFTSSQGYGIRVDTGGTDHYDHGAYVTSQGGYGVYAQSATNQGVRGEAGNTTGIAQPLGAVGVVGIGSNRGTYGSSAGGIGVYGVSNTNYGVWGSSNTYHGVTGRTSNSDNNYGFYTPDNLYALNYNLMGATMQVMQNGGVQPLESGDVVVFSGVSEPLEAGGPPVIQVVQANEANSSAVAGVVYSRFNIEAVVSTQEHADENDPPAHLEVTPDGPVPAGEFLLVVIQGPALVKADGLAEAIAVGDLLTSSGAVGYAMKATAVTINDVQTAVPGTVLGKALEAVNGEQKRIYVFVSLQ